MERLALEIVGWGWGLTEIRMFFLRGLPGSQRKDAGSSVLILVSIGVAVVLINYFGFWPPQLGHIPLQDVGWFGVILVLAGVLLRQWSINILGQFFTPEVKISSQQRLVESGPYRILRHPSYAGMLVIFIGLGLGTMNWLLVFILVADFAAALGYRIRVEERELRTAFGREYEDYRMRTWALVPFVF